MEVGDTGQFAARDTRDVEARRKLGWLTALRAVTVTALLGAAFAANIIGSGAPAVVAPTQVFIYATVIGTYVLTVVFALLLRTRLDVKVQSYVQVAFDVVICTLLVYVTGGIDSIFLFVYSLTIINASILLERTGALAAAVMSWSAFGALVALQANNWIPISPGWEGPNPPLRVLDVAFSLCMSFAGFHLVALLSGHLATQLRAAAVALAEERRARETMKALHDSIVKTLNDGLVIVDLSGRVTFANRAVEELTSREVRELVGRPLVNVIPAAGHVLELAREGPVARQELPYVRSDGFLMQLGFSASPYLGNAAEPAGSIVLIQDLTQLRAMEEAVRTSERLAAIGEVAAGLAHEIRNPLASLSGSIELLRTRAMPTSDTNGRRLMDIVLRETERLNDLITAFLGFARPSAPIVEPVDLDRLVEDTLAVFANDEDAGARHRLVKELRCEGRKARVDVGQMKQVLWNLLLNAAQAMPAGGTITVRTYPATGFAHLRGVTIEVADEGPGIDPRFKNKIFDPFFTTKEKGTGLGLATVYRIVDAHGGKVEVDGAPGKGAMFRVRLPGA